MLTFSLHSLLMEAAANIVEMYAGYRMKALDNLFDYGHFLRESGYEQNDVDAVRNKLAKYKEVPKFVMNEQLLTFLIRCNGDVRQTGKRLRAFYRCKKDIPEFFQNRDPDSQEIQHCFDNQYYITFPVMPCNSNLMYMSLSNFDPKNYDFDSASKTFIMICEAHLYEKGPRPDTIFLFDMIGAKLAHALRPSISSIRRGMNFLENATPLSFKAIHVLNAPEFMSYIFSLVKPFATSGIISKVHLHTSSIDWEDFYKRHIPRSHLPKDYGGDLKSIRELSEEQREKMFLMKEYFEFEDMQSNRVFDELLGDHAKDIVW